METDRLRKLIDEDTYLNDLALSLHNIQQELARFDMKSLIKQVHELRQDVMYLKQNYRLTYKRYEEYFSKW